MHDNSSKLRQVLPVQCKHMRSAPLTHSKRIVGRWQRVLYVNSLTLRLYRAA